VRWRAVACVFIYQLSRGESDWRSQRRSLLCAATAQNLTTRIPVLSSIRPAGSTPLTPVGDVFKDGVFLTLELVGGEWEG
jgi:hypothetical protein